MTADEALDRLKATYHSPLLGVVREELGRLRSEVIGWQTLAAEAGENMEKARSECAGWRDAYEDAKRDAEKARARVEELADDCRELSQMGFEDGRNKLRAERDALQADLAAAQDCTSFNAYRALEKELRLQNEANDMIATERDVAVSSHTYWVASAHDEKKRAERAEADLAAARARVAELETERDSATLGTLGILIRALTQERDDARAELAAARALLREAQAYVVPDHGWDWEGKGGYLFDRIDAALDGGKK